MLDHCYGTEDATNLHLEISYAEADERAEIALSCDGADYNPFDQEDDGLGITILKKMAIQLDYRRERTRSYITIKM